MKTTIAGPYVIPIHLAQGGCSASTLVLTVCGIQTSPRHGRVTCFRADATCKYCLR